MTGTDRRWSVRSPVPGTSEQVVKVEGVSREVPRVFLVILAFVERPGEKQSAEGPHSCS